MFVVVSGETVNNTLCSQQSLILSSSIVSTAERKTLTVYFKKWSQDATALSVIQPWKFDPALIWH